jgi:hypothetical protein
MEVPLIALIAPIRRAGAGAVCACGAGTTGAAASGAPTALAAKNKLDKSVAGEIVFRKIVLGEIMDRIDVLVSRIRPSINLHALLAPEWLIYKVLPE